MPFQYLLSIVPKPENLCRPFGTFYLYLPVISGVYTPSYEMSPLTGLNDNYFWLACFVKIKILRMPAAAFILTQYACIESL